MRLKVFASSRFADHVTPPGHPERVSRNEVLLSVAADLRTAGADVVEPRRVPGGQFGPARRPPGH